MAATTGNIDFVTPDNEIQVPSCPHGPALLFRKYVQGSNNGREFFACSAFRDRKQCQFFRWAEDQAARPAGAPASFLQLGIPPQQLQSRFQEFWQLEEGQRRFCSTCGLLLLPGDEGHSEHSVVDPVTSAMLSHPTTLFQPLEDNKTFAQYLFSKPSVEFVVSTLRKLNITHVLCIGLPRLHEALAEVATGNGTVPGLSSLLLDLDQRYMQIYPPHSFCHYNMFNHHFFGGPESQAVFEQFLGDSGPGSQGWAKVAVLMDPPFGGMVEPLCCTLKKIHQAWTRTAKPPDAHKLPILWFFPYFMEARITSTQPDLTMLDYKVDYTNHALFHGAKSGRKKGSPVRIFTNLPASQLVLPAEDDYWWCDICKQYSAPENKHCSQCNRCTSKDGSTYVHCELCGTCVKPSWKHCPTCQRCDQADHNCHRKTTGCHICGDEGHKRRQCPEARRKKESPQARSKKSRKRKKSQASDATQVQTKKSK